MGNQFLHLSFYQEHLFNYKKKREKILFSQKIKIGSITSLIDNSNTLHNFPTMIILQRYFIIIGKIEDNN